jgi:predicted small secreted protein
LLWRVSIVLSSIDVQAAITHGVDNMNMLLLMAMLAVLSLTGCETMEGLGRDLQNLGDSIEGKSSDDG